MGAGGQPALIEGHQETDCPCPRIIILGSGFRAMVFYKSRHIAIEVEFGPIDLKIYGMRYALGEDFKGYPFPVFLPLRKIDHRLLGAPQVKWRLSAAHGFSDGFNVRISIIVE